MRVKRRITTGRVSALMRGYALVTGISKPIRGRTTAFRNFMLKTNDPAGAPDAPLVSLMDGAIGYGGTPMFQGMNLAIRPGEFWGLIGPNGAGKSTLLKTLLGVLAPLAGRVTRSKGLVIGYVPQRAAIDPIYPFSAMDVVRSGTLGHPRHTWGLFSRIATADRGLATLRRVGIERLAHRPFRDLSGGEQQRVLVARGLVRDPDLLILDEPATGMDLPSEGELLDTITRLNRELGIAVLMVVHQISLVVGRARHLALISRERKLFHAAPAEEILSDAVLSELYEHPMSVVTCPEGMPLVVAGRKEGDAP